MGTAIAFLVLYLGVPCAIAVEYVYSINNKTEKSETEYISENTQIDPSGSNAPIYELLKAESERWEREELIEATAGEKTQRQEFRVRFGAKQHEQAVCRAKRMHRVGWYNKQLLCKNRKGEIHSITPPECNMENYSAENCFWRLNREQKQKIKAREHKALEELRETEERSALLINLYQSYYIKK